MLMSLDLKMLSHLEVQIVSQFQLATQGFVRLEILLTNAKL